MFEMLQIIFNEFYNASNSIGIIDYAKTNAGTIINVAIGLMISLAGILLIKKLLSFVK